MTELELPDPERLISAILTSHQWPRGYSRQEGTPSSLRRSPVASAALSTWTVEPMPSGYRVIDANGVVLAHVYGQPDGGHCCL
jgi:hypothetical protein